MLMQRSERIVRRHIQRLGRGGPGVRLSPDNETGNFFEREHSLFGTQQEAQLQSVVLCYVSFIMFRTRNANQPYRVRLTSSA